MKLNVTKRDNIIDKIALTIYGNKKEVFGIPFYTKVSQ